MSKYAEFINNAKDKCTKEWLTPSQLNAFEIVKDKSDNHRIVNIYGREGVGKTFLGWVLEKEGISDYYVDLESFNKCNSDIITIDNFVPSRSEHRDFRRKMGFLGIKKAILITRPFAIPDDVKKVEIMFEEDDRIKFKNNCSTKLRVQFRNENDQDNMHELLKKTIWRDNR